MQSILIIDDEDAIRDCMQIILQSDAVCVDLAGNLEEALDRLRSQIFNLVITDLRLTSPEGREGLDIIEHVKKSTPETHVVLFTAFGSPEIESEARRLGATDCWQKASIAIPEILARVRRLGISVF